MRRSSTTRALQLTAFASLMASSLAAMPPDEVAGWRSDLELAHARLVETHPDPWRKTPRIEVERAFDSLSERLPDLSPAAAMVALAEVVASLGDGHTRLSLPIPFEAGFVDGHAPTEPPALEALRFHVLPLRLGLYAEGVFVERIDQRHERIAGAQVVAVGGVPIEEAMRRLAPVIRHDNEEQLRDLMPMHLVIPELLHARGLSAEPRSARWTLVSPDGEHRELPLEADEEGGPVEWASALGPWNHSALSFRHLTPGLAPRRGAFSEPYWFDRWRDSGVLYLQYNLAEDAGEENLIDFASRLRRELDAAEFERLVVDLRWNWGGNNSASRPLLHALIASEALRQPGALVVLVGRGTFSAGMMFATDLERHLRPVFVGEPTGSAPNHAGDARRFRLPYSGLTLRVSTLWWQYGGPRDRRDSIAPNLPVPLTWRDLVAGRDPVLEAVIGPSADAPLTGTWRGTMTPPSQQFPLEAVFDERDGALAGQLAAGELGAGLELVDARKEGARVEFRINRPNGDLQFSGVIVGERIFGRVIYAGVRSEPFAFGLWRSVDR